MTPSFGIPGMPWEVAAVIVVIVAALTVWGTITVARIGRIKVIEGVTEERLQTVIVTALQAMSSAITSSINQLCGRIDEQGKRIDATHARMDHFMEILVDILAKGKKE